MNQGSAMSQRRAMTLAAAAIDPTPDAGCPANGCYDADVVILTLDRVADSEQAIKSALAQVGVSRFVVVVDQGSQPDNLARLAALVAGRDDATLVSLTHNLGVPGGRNHGAALGHGRVIVGLDNDAEFADSRTLARAVAALDEDPGLAAIGMRILVHSTGDDDRSSWGYPPGLLSRAGEAFDAVTFVGAGHAIRRTAWDAAGGYDDALFFCWEELDFCLRAIALGWRIRYRGDVVVRHKVSPERRITWSGARWFFFVRNRLYIGRKWGSGWAALTPRLLGYLFKGLCNGMFRQTLLAVPAAVRLSGGLPRRQLSARANAYVARNDAAHRGSWWTRLRGEVFTLLPGAGS
jgi:GT2 family glycosyltransferase